MFESAACIKTSQIPGAMSHAKELFQSDILGGWRATWQTMYATFAKQARDSLRLFSGVPTSDAVRYPLKHILYINLKKCTLRQQHMEKMLQTRAPHITRERVVGIHLSEEHERIPDDVQKFIHEKGLVPCDLKGKAMHISSYKPFQMKWLPAIVEWSIYFAHARAISACEDRHIGTRRWCSHLGG
jgi:hypothetical protein